MADRDPPPPPSSDPEVLEPDEVVFDAAETAFMQNAAEDDAASPKPAVKPPASDKAAS